MIDISGHDESESGILRKEEKNISNFRTLYHEIYKQGETPNRKIYLRGFFTRATTDISYSRVTSLDGLVTRGFKFSVASTFTY